MKKLVLMFCFLGLIKPCHSFGHPVFADRIQPENDCKLAYSLTPIPGMKVEFEVEEDSLLFISGHIDAHTQAYHDGFGDMNIGVAFDVLLDGCRAVGSVTGENIDKPRHYYSADLDGLEYLDAGEHTVQVRGRSYSSTFPGQGKLANVRAKYSNLIILVFPIESFVEE